MATGVVGEGGRNLDRTSHLGWPGRMRAFVGVTKQAGPWIFSLLGSARVALKADFSFMR